MPNPLTRPAPVLVIVNDQSAATRRAVFAKLAERAPAMPSPATKAMHPQRFAKQLAARRRYLADLAEALGLDPAEAVRRLH